MGKTWILGILSMGAALLLSSCQESKELPKGKELSQSPAETVKPEAPAKVEPKRDAAPVQSKTEAKANSWTWCGWGGGGFFWCCAADPSNPDVLYLGGDVAGMYKSVDKGRSWRFINKGISNYGVYSVAVSKSDPNIVYIMTTNGMCRSSDGGESWTPLAETLKSKLDISVKRHSTVRGIAIDPSNPDVVYAGSKKGELFKSLDGGAAWKKLTYLPKAGTSDEQARIESGDILLISDFEGGAKNEGWEANTKYESKLSSSVSASSKYACSGKGSLEIDFNAGSPSWKESGRVQKYYGGKDFSKYKTLSARFYVPEGAPKLMGQLVAQCGDKWLWQASDRVDGVPGKWTEVRLDLEKLLAMNDVKAVYFIILSPYAPYNGKVYLDSVAFTTSSAGAFDPSKLSGGRNDGTVSSVSIAQGDSKTIFVSNTEQGVFRSSDGGESWTQMKLPAAATNVKVAPSDDKRVYASFKEGALMKSSDGGETWNPASEGIDIKYDPYEILVHPGNPDKVWCIANKSWSGRIYRSEDGGKSWQSGDEFKVDLIGDPTLPNEYDGELKSGMRKFSTLTNITLSDADPDTILASANWRNVISRDGGKTWEESSKGADITCTQDVFFLKDKVFAVAMDEGLFVSENGGGQWRQLIPLKYLPGTSGHQWRVWAAEKDGKLKIVSTCSPWNASPDCNNMILLSEDGGKSFKSVKQGLPDYVSKVNCMWGRSYPRALAVDPSNSDVMYLGIDGDPEPAKNLSGGGVFKSVDGGNSWTQLPNQPPSRRMFFGLAVDPTNPKRLFWGACGERGGLYVSEDTGGSWGKCDGIGDTWIFNALVTPKGTAYCSGNNLWRSADGGKTWAKLTDNKIGTIVGIAFDPADENRLFISCVTWGEDASGAIRMSEDGGRTWKDITFDIPYVKPLILRYNSETKELWAAGVGIFKMKI